MNYKVDQEICIGCALCTSICSNVFKIDDTGKAVAFNSASLSDEDMARDALSSCPVQAISVE